MQRSLAAAAGRHRRRHAPGHRRLLPQRFRSAELHSQMRVSGSDWRCSGSRGERQKRAQSTAASSIQRSGAKLVRVRRRMRGRPQRPLQGSRHGALELALHLLHQTLQRRGAAHHLEHVRRQHARHLLDRLLQKRGRGRWHGRRSRGCAKQDGGSKQLAGSTQQLQQAAALPPLASRHFAPAAGNAQQQAKRGRRAAERACMLRGLMSMLPFLGSFMPFMAAARIKRRRAAVKRSGVGIGPGRW